MALNTDRFKYIFHSILKDYSQSSEEDIQKFWQQSGDIADLAQASAENVLQFKLKGRESFFIRKVKHALEKIENGTFGQCEECGEEIEEKRLLARPMATQCITCKEEQERGESHIPYRKRSHTHGRGLNAGNVIRMHSDNEISKEGVLKFGEAQKNLGLQ